ncbi:MAG: type II toxin-antitoxin system RelE/ParE family toxin [Candidatus Omnitrophota bacterium]|jgi:plasmid stabilization system protein ParE
MKRTYKVVITSSAEEDLKEIVDFIAEDEPGIALKIFEKLEMRIKGLKELPDRGRIVPELKDKDILAYREIIESPWRIVYSINEGIVYILFIIDGRRSVNDIFLRKLVK